MTPGPCGRALHGCGAETACRFVHPIAIKHVIGPALVIRTVGQAMRRAFDLLHPVAGKLSQLCGAERRGSQEVSGRLNKELLMITPM